MSGFRRSGSGGGGRIPSGYTPTVTFAGLIPSRLAGTLCGWSLSGSCSLPVPGDAAGPPRRTLAWPVHSWLGLAGEVSAD